jgi:hypothetical protein
VSAGIESTLDHPFFGPGDADNRAGSFVADGIVELLYHSVSGCSRVFLACDEPRSSGCRLSIHARHRLEPS